MGTLRYDGHSDPIIIDDVELAHLRVVMGTKLRRQESFTMSWHAASGNGSQRVCTAWIHPAIPLQFLFDAPQIPTVNPDHINDLMHRVNATGDLFLGQPI